ncbi:CDC42 small effector protein 2-A-like [Pomacea canaliculata]|uniref:CDC42 small effector protein 2-A-like n=1 Tax=Pomacea canaliculata TaxID=400727 RepID=UPI000D73548B|nr:CDC42 small effector protein 2-A-like [Pomacea canaliculata]
MMGDALLCFSCCITEQPQPKRRRRIDPSMIGLPTNFRHTAHIGSGDVPNSFNSSHLHSVQNQMASKGDYEHHLSPGHLQLAVVELPRKNP